MRCSRSRMRGSGLVVLALFFAMLLTLVALFPLVGQVTSEPEVLSSEPMASAPMSSERAIVERSPQKSKAVSATAEESKAGAKTGIWAWFWSLADKREPNAPAANDLGKAAVFAIALLAAFLTVVEVWQIPPPRRSLRTENGDEEPRAGAGASAGGTAPDSPPGPSYGGATLQFNSNFARTVLGGLAGMALVATFDGFWKSENNGFSEEPLYLVLFVLFFLSFLILSAGFRGFTEAMRSRVSLARRRVPGASAGQRFWAWLLSLRIPTLVFFDTGFNVIQGRNQLQTAAFEHDIVELHTSIVEAAERIRKRLDEAFLEALSHRRDGAARNGKARSDASVRVSISLMACDERSVFYVAREVGSLSKAFGRESIAWLALHTGQPLWHQDGVEPAKALEIDNSDGRYEDLPKRHLRVDEYLEKRNQSDYQAFVVLPLPWGHRGEAEGYRKAGIHVSFRHGEDLEFLWPTLNQAHSNNPAGVNSGPPDLLGQEEKPEPKNQKLAVTLQMSAVVLTELFRYFNDLVFEEQIRPTREPN